MKKQYSSPEFDIIRFDNDSDILTLSVGEGGSAVEGEGSIGGWASNWIIGNYEAPEDSTEVKSIFD